MKPLPSSAEHYGLYKYNGQVFVSKSQALDLALIRGDFNPDIKFTFHDDIFGSLDWTKEPSESLDELYQQRARQLRDKYDYIIVLFSGGIDSDNVLHAFLNAGVFVDEIQTYWPLSVVEKIEPVYDIHHPLGSFFEYKLSVLPKLKKFHQASPKTKITTIDTTNYTVERWNERFLADEVNHLRFQHGMTGALMHYCISDTCNAICDKLKHQKVAVVYGSERVRPIVTNDEVTFAFHDLGFSGFYNLVYNAYTSRYTPELFYWTKDSPYIPVKQLHLIKNAMEQDDRLYNSIIKPEKRNTVSKYRLLSEYLINPIIYPHWDQSYQKLVKDENEIFLKYVAGDKYENHVNTEKLRTKTFVTPFHDTIIDLKTKYHAKRYSKIVPEKSFVIVKNDAEPHIYNVWYSMLTRAYSAGKLKRTSIQYDNSEV